MPSLTEQLNQARDHVAQAQKRIDEQVVLIERLQADGHDTGTADHLLATYIELMAKLTVYCSDLERKVEERRRVG